MTSEGSADKPKKKFYSKLGCRECKRRKIKCDESKPACMKCTRLDKVCVYPMLGEKVLRVSKKFLAQSPLDDKYGVLDQVSLSGGVKLPAQGEGRPQGEGQLRGHSVSGDISTDISDGSNQVPGGIHSSHVSITPRIPSLRPSTGVSSDTISADLTASNLTASNLTASNLGSNLPSNIGAPVGPPIGAPLVVPVPSIGVGSGTGGTGSAATVSASAPGSGLPGTIGPTPSPSFNTGFQPFPSYPYVSTQSPTQNPSTNTATNTNPTTSGATKSNTSFSAPLATFHPSIKYKPTSSYILNSANSPSDQESTKIASPVSKTSNSPGHEPSNSTGTLMNTDDSFNLKNDALFDVYFNREDLDLLASDLNNLVGSIMVESNFDKKSEDFDAASSESNSTVLNAQPTPPSIPIMRSMYSNDSNSIPRNIPYNFIRLSSNHEKYYLEQFYNDFSMVILPFLPYDSLVGGYFNPARDIIIFCASKEPFLLAAILAQGAKIAHNKTNMPKYEESYCNYLAKCLKLLGPALNDESHDRGFAKRTNSRKKLASNIESVLLTVLILTSSNASNTKQNWRPHLKGAKDLLMKYAVHSDLKGSKALIFCKTWYVSFELLAALSSKKGGTLLNDHEIDLIMRLDDPDVIQTLREIGIINENGFNYMFGFHHSLLPSIKGLIKLLNASRKDQLHSYNSLNNVQLISEFYQSSKFTFLSEKKYLSPKDFSGKIPEGILLDHQKVNDNDVYVNWLDIAHSSYCYAGILTVLTKGFGLPFDHLQVKPITSKLISAVVILKDVPNPKVGYKPLMIQWPMLVGGLNCYKEEQKALVQQFFRISGSGSAGFSIHIIDKVWNKHKNKNNLSDDSDLDIDTVTY